MSLWRQLTHGLRVLKDRPAVDAEIDDEVHDFYERAREDRIREGLSAEEAARAVRRDLGDEEHAREQLGAYGWERVAETTLADLRHALRRLRRSPSFALTAVLTLGLCIGASTAIFSAVRPILFEPLPYPDADRIVTLTDSTADGAPLDTTYGSYVEVSERSRSFDVLAVATEWDPALTGAGESERLDGDRVSAGYFRALGVAPAAGRDFIPDDEAIGAAQYAMLTDSLARRRFGSAEAVVNQTIILDDVPHTVVGVMPAGFENVLAPSAELWAPLQFDMSQGPAWATTCARWGGSGPGLATAGRPTSSTRSAGRPPGSTASSPAASPSGRARSGCARRWARRAGPSSPW
jgi:hypothetical protein